MDGNLVLFYTNTKQRKFNGLYYEYIKIVRVVNQKGVEPYDACKIFSLLRIFEFEIKSQ